MLMAAVSTCARAAAATRTELSFNGADLHLESYPALSAMGVNLGGIISGDGDIYISQDDIAADHGMVHLTASDASYRMLAGTPPLKLGNLTAIIKLDQGKVTIEQLESHGGDLTLSGRGVIELDPNLPDSEVAIKFQLATTPVGRKQLGVPAEFPAASAEFDALFSAWHAGRAGVVVRTVQDSN